MKKEENNYAAQEKLRAEINANVYPPISAEIFKKTPEERLELKSMKKAFKANPSNFIK